MKGTFSPPTINSRPRISNGPGERHHLRIGRDRRDRVRVALEHEMRHVGVIGDGVEQRRPLPADDQTSCDPDGGDGEHDDGDHDSQPSPAAQPRAGQQQHASAHGRYPVPTLDALDHVPVSDHDDPIGSGRDLGIVGHHDDRLSRCMLGAQQVEHQVGGHTVERPGRLVGEQQIGLIGHRSGDRHPLLFASRQSSREITTTLRQAERIEQLAASILRGAPRDACQALRELDVGGHIEMREQVVLLEHVTDPTSTEHGALGRAQGGDLLTGDRDRTTVGEIEAAEQVQHGRLSATAGTHHGDPRSTIDGDRQSAQHRTLDTVSAERLHQVGGFEQRAHSTSVANPDTRRQGRTSRAE